MRRFLIGITLLSLLVIVSTLAWRTFARPVLCDACSVVVISLDAVNATSFEEDMPLLAERARASGVVFERAYASTKWGLPGTAALLTGEYPWDLGIWNDRRGLPKDTDTIATVFSAYGYTTAAFAQGPFIDRAWGMDRGFHVWEAAAGQTKTYETDVIPSARAWITQTPEPYFAFIQPYSLYELFDAENQGLAFSDLQQAYAGDEAAANRLKDGYARRLGEIDQELNAFLDTALAGERAKKTVVVITASYGQDFIDTPTKGVGGVTLPTHHVLNVPLVFFIPDQKPKRVTPSVESRHMAATIFDIVGADHSPLTGESLLPYMRGGETEQQTVRAASSWDPADTLIEPPAEFYASLERRRRIVLIPETTQAAPYVDNAAYATIRGTWQHLETTSGDTYLFNTQRDPQGLENLYGRLNTLPPRERLDALLFTSFIENLQR
ncbi:MAG TPA: sulfatase-like hydrolase/transferase [Candidatus Paceibacterota bacterium]|nr:sulfatase-like hydrolase/transferase [Candidatus Paceibacterota bacterium]